MLKVVKEISDKLEALSGNEITWGLRGGKIRTNIPINIMGSYCTDNKLYIVNEDEMETTFELNDIVDVYLGEFGSSIKYNDGSSVDFSWDEM